MSTRALLVGLCLFVAAHVTAKPPDLPLPTRPDLTPEESVAQPLVAEEQPSPAAKSEACCPLESFFRDLAMPVLSGPFGTNFCTCRKVKTPHESSVLPEAYRFLILAEFCRHSGFADDACDCYMSVCDLQPGTCLAAHAASRLESLCVACASPEEEAQTDDCAAALFEKAECCMHRGDLETACKLFEEIVRSCSGERLGKLAAERLKSLNGLRKQTRKKAVTAPHVFASYDLSDLVCEVAGNNIRNSIGELTTAHELKRYIVGHVHPGSWEGQGGKGCIEYNAETNSLVVRHSEGVQHEVTNLLSNLRAMHHAGRTPTEWLTRKNKEAQTGDSEEASAESREFNTAPAMVTMGYDLSELLSGSEQPEAVVAEVLRAIENGIAPKSWQGNGGPGSIAYNAELKTFFIANTPEAHEAIHNLLDAKSREIKRRGEEERQDSRSGAAVIDQLLVACRTALRDGKQDEATKLARRALALDRKAVMAHPLVYKMQLLRQVFNEPELLQPRMPGVDPNVIRAYSEILDACPKCNDKVLHATFKATDEECELELVPSVCAEKDGNRVRFQLQTGNWTLKIVDEGKGRSSLSISLSCTGTAKP